MIVIHPSKFFRVEVVVGAAVLAACVLTLVVTARPAEAAFPGANGKIVFASERTSGDGVDSPEGDSEIFTMNPDGSELTQLTRNDTDDEDPVYSADGRQIAFVRWREWDPEDFQWTTDIYTMSADGRNETRVTSTDLSNEFSPSWSPDGNYIAFELFDPDTNSANIQPCLVAGRQAYSVPEVCSVGFEAVVPDGYRSDQASPSRTHKPSRQTRGESGRA